jgi:hypothetical protein
MSNEQLFTSGYIVCLANITDGGKRIETSHEEAWRSLGSPSAREVAKLDLSPYDRQACNALRKACR